MDAEEFSKVINDLKVKPGGTLRFYGKWFGRPYDNYHTLLDSCFNEGILLLKFDTGEQIKIWQPRNIMFNTKKLIIKESSCVEFIRYSYGKARTEENLIMVRYSFATTFNSSITGGKVYNKIINESCPAVELLSL